MEKLRSLNRIVDISEPILAEDSTFSTIALSLNAVLEQLDKEHAKHHDYLVALLLVFLAECGFNILSDTSKCERNTRLVNIPTTWKSQGTSVYQIYLTLYNIDCSKSKLIAIPFRDRLVLNMSSCAREKESCIKSMVVQTLKYVNPYTKNVYFRYMNLKELSHRFKDTLVMPLRTEILLASDLMGPSLECLPIELLLKIKNMLSPIDIGFLSLCSQKLNDKLSYYVTV